MTNQEITYGEWIGGKPMGHTIEKTNEYQVIFRKKKILVAFQSFPISNYASKKCAFAAAEEFRRETSDKLGMTKNKYCFFRDEHGHECIRVRLQREDIVMLCNIDHVKIIEESIWTGARARRDCPDDTMYVARHNSVKKGQKRCYFHNRIYPDLLEVDHINRNGLDNRKCNVRDGSGRINSNNKREQRLDNISGKKGVNYRSEVGHERWICNWVDINGKRITKSFSVKTYGYDEAFRLACETRDKNRYVPPSPPSVQELEDTGQHGPLPITIHTQTWEISDTLKRLKPTESLVYDPAYFELYVPDDPRFAFLFIDKRPYFDPSFADFE